MSTDPYRLLVRDQAGAERILRELGALAEIERAVLAHCQGDSGKSWQSSIKSNLFEDDWTKEVRVPPFNQRWDHLPINERYDAWKSFPLRDRNFGVAVEIEAWQIWADLLKFRRGLERGQICAGVIVHDSPYHLDYCFEHMRHVSEPLFGTMPVTFVAPEGPGLKPPKLSTKKYAPYVKP